MVGMESGATVLLRVAVMWLDFSAFDFSRNHFVVKLAVRATEAQVCKTWTKDCAGKVVLLCEGTQIGRFVRCHAARRLV